MDPQDPRTKQQIKDLLYDFLYEPCRQRLHRQLESLVLTNCRVQNADYQGFIYKGHTYSVDTRMMPRKMPRLVPHLHPNMEAYLAEVRKVNEEELPFVLGFINQVLNASNDLQDYLRVLPDCLHPPIQALIDSCNCRTNKLSESDVSELQSRNQTSIDLIRQRLLLNLLE